METSKCQLKKQGLAPGSCLVKVDGKHQAWESGRFIHNDEDRDYLLANIDMSAV